MYKNKNYMKKDFEWLRAATDTPSLPWRRLIHTHIGLSI